MTLMFKRFQQTSLLFTGQAGYEFSPADAAHSGGMDGRLPGFMRRPAARVLAAWTRGQQRRAIAAMGPVARRELHELLLAQGRGGLPLSLWSAADREQDATALGDASPR